MITLNDVSKTYISKSKQRVDALRGVSFELGNTGMVFILGKSGSGKSTLLNLLGGLDSPTSGEIIVDGVSMKDFKQVDYDGYRNGYVGFVFQEYNLLDDFNVRDNIAIALQLSKGDNIDQKVVHALEQVELSSNYLTRRVGEMSGGEKQRIAIARSIVKDSHMILADEPTGNLDSATGESIWNILKNLSKSKLVVIVSHDRESAERYADRIIEIADGNVIGDTNAQHNEDVTNDTFVPKKNHLSFKACFKMAFNNIRQRKVRTICTVLLAVVTTLTLLVTQVSLSYTPERSIARFIEQNNVQYISVAQRTTPFDTVVDKHDSSKYSNARLNLKAVDYMKENSLCFVDNCVDSKQDILDLGLTFVGEAMELMPNSYYILKSNLDQIFNGDDWGSYIALDGERSPVLLRDLGYDLPYDYFVGKKVIFINCSDYYSLNSPHIDVEEYPTLCGVIDTDNINRLSLDALPGVFVTRDISAEFISRSISFNNSEIDTMLELGYQTYTGKFTVSSSTKIDPFSDNALLTVDGLEKKELIGASPENDNEIYITFDLYSQLFGGAMTDYVDANLTQVIQMPYGLGKTFPMKLYDYGTANVFGDVGELTIAGIFFSTNTDPYASGALTIVATRNTQLAIYRMAEVDKPVTIRTDTVKNMTEFLTTLRYEYSIPVFRLGRIPEPDGDIIKNGGSYSQPIYEFEDSVATLQKILIIICVALVVALVLMVINMISFSITNRKREIGILSALGTSNKDITVIFLLETLFIAILCFVIGMIAILIAQPIINIQYSVDYPYVIPYFNIDMVTVAVLVASSFVLLPLAALIPILRIANLKPIDAIRNV